MMCFPIPSRINVHHTRYSGEPVITTVSKYDRNGRRIEYRTSSFSGYEEKPQRRHRHRRRDSYESEDYSSTPYRTSMPMVYPPSSMTPRLPPPPPMGPPMHGGMGQPSRLLLEGPGTLPQAGMQMGFNSGMGMRGPGMGGMNRPFDTIDATPMGPDLYPPPGPPPYNTHGGHAPPPPPIDDDAPFPEPMGRPPRHNTYMDGEFGGGGGLGRRSSLPKGVRMGGGLPSGIRYGQGNIMDDDDMVVGGGYPGPGRFRN